MALATGTEVMETATAVEPDRFEKALKSEARVNEILRRAQMWTVMGIYGVIMLWVGNSLGMGMNFGYVP